MNIRILNLNRKYVSLENRQLNLLLRTWIIRTILLFETPVIFHFRTLLNINKNTHYKCAYVFTSMAIENYVSLL